jgi:CRISPR-associated protein Cmr6
MKMAQIPMAGDLAELIGAAAEKVENRSLLLDKFVFHKRWPLASDSRGVDIKWDAASRWSFMRIARGASYLLNREAKDRRREAQGQNVELDKKERLLAEAKVAETLAGVSWDTKELAILRAKHSRRFVSLFRSAYGERAAIAVGELKGRLAINLADSLIQNAGICLDRLFGLPYIPGSAVKGVCRHKALGELRAAQGIERARVFDIFCAVFGTAENDFMNGELCDYRDLVANRPMNQRGLVAFLPAYPVNEAEAVVDLTNVHYPDYYRTGAIENLAKERPQPNPFPAVEVGAQFAFCLVLSRSDTDKSVLEAAHRWLQAALTVEGLGAKTAAGYGWFSMRPDVLEQVLAEEQREAKAAAAKIKAESEARMKAEEEERRKAALSPVDRTKDELMNMNDEAFAQFAKALAEKTPDEQRAFISLLSGQKRDRWKTWKKKKPDLANSINVIRTHLQLPPLP